MKLRLHQRAAIAVGLAVPASTCAPTPPAVRWRSHHSATPPAEPSTTSGAVVPTSVPESSATTVPETTTTITMVLPHATTTTTIVLPENTDAAKTDDEWAADQRMVGARANVSWYGAESGTKTADGSAFDGSQLVFAHRTMAFGTVVRFCTAAGCVSARCADRGPAAYTGRDFDLSRAVFAAVAPLSAGVVEVSWSVVG